MRLESVACANDARLHLVRRTSATGCEGRTLCLRKWTEREPAREGDEFCSECLERLQGESVEC